MIVYEFCFSGRIACKQCIRYGILLQMSHIAWFVCLFVCVHVCVCVLGTRVSSAKTAESIKMLSGVDACGSKEPCSR